MIAELFPYDWMDDDDDDDDDDDSDSDSDSNDSDDDDDDYDYYDNGRNKFGLAQQELNSNVSNDNDERRQTLFNYMC